MFKKLSLFVLSFALMFAITPIFLPTKSAKAASPYIDQVISNVSVTQNSDKTFTIRYTLNRNLESYETLSIVGSWPAAYRGAVPDVGVTTYKTKATYTVHTSAATSSGWLTFNIKYLASGGSQGYQESKYVTSYYVGGEWVQNFHTVTAYEAGLEWVSWNIFPNLAISFAKMDPRYKLITMAAYTAFINLDGFTDATNMSPIHHIKAGEYVRTVHWFDYSSGYLNTKVEIYTSKEAYDKNVSPEWEGMRSYYMPKY